VYFNTFIDCIIVTSNSWNLTWNGWKAESVLPQGPDPSGSRYVDPLSVLRHWQLVLKYLPVLTSTRVLVKVLG